MFVAKKLYNTNEKSGHLAVRFVAPTLFPLVRCQDRCVAEELHKNILAMLLERKTVICNEKTGHVAAMFVPIKLVF